MKRNIAFQPIVALIIALTAIMTVQASDSTFKIPVDVNQIGNINFSQYPVGSWYTLERMNREWNPRMKNGDDPIDFKGIIHNRAIIAQNSKFTSNVLRAMLPKQKILPDDTGIQIFGDIGGYNNVYFGNSIFLSPDFECGKEIKIPPGIYGGWKFGTGGSIPDGIKIGPSIRAVIQNCQAKSYIYHLNQTGDNGEGGYPGSPANGDKFTWKFHDGKPVIISKGEKHDIMFSVAMNTPGKKNGVHRVWYDGTLVLSLENLEFRKIGALKLNTVGVEIFRGGGDMSYATPNDNMMDVSNFVIYAK